MSYAQAPGKGLTSDNSASSSPSSSPLAAAIAIYIQVVVYHISTSAQKSSRSSIYEGYRYPGNYPALMMPWLHVEPSESDTLGRRASAIARVSMQITVLYRESGSGCDESPVRNEASGNSTPADAGYNAFQFTLVSLYTLYYPAVGTTLLILLICFILVYRTSRYSVVRLPATAVTAANMPREERCCCPL